MGNRTQPFYSTEDCWGLLVLILSYPLPHVLEASRVTVAFVAASWLFDPDKTYITTLVYNRHLPIVELNYASREAGQTVPDILLSPSSGYTTWPQWKGRSFFQDPFWVSGLRKQAQKILLGFGCVHCGSATLVVLPCAVSSTRTWVNQLLTLVHYWNSRGPPPTYLRPWVTWTSILWICYSIAEQYWAAWGFSEQYGSPPECSFKANFMQFSKLI